MPQDRLYASDRVAATIDKAARHILANGETLASLKDLLYQICEIAVDEAMPEEPVIE